MKTVDVIIPTYKPDERLLKLVEKLNEQTYKVNQILLINTEEKFFEQQFYGTHFFEKNKNIVIRHQSIREFDHGKTRANEVKRSQSDIFVCMTQDAVPENEFLIEELVKALEAEDVAVAYAKQLPTKDCGEIEKYTRSFNYPEQSMVKSEKDVEKMGIKTYFCSNVCAAYDRNIYEKLGGFIRHTIFNEDMIYAAKAVKSGYQIAYVAAARVIHSHNYSNKEQIHRNFDLGVSQADHPEVFEGIKSESEGIKLLKDTSKYLKENHKTGLIPHLYMQCGCKYLGYRLGKNYRVLPRWLILKLTMSKEYWMRDNMVKASSRIDATRGYGRTEEELRK